MGKWYDSTLELVYGELFPPYCIRFNYDFSERIDIGKKYKLNSSIFVVGECELLKVKKIVRNSDFLIKSC